MSLNPLLKRLPGFSFSYNFSFHLRDACAVSTDEFRLKKIRARGMGHAMREYEWWIQIMANASVRERCKRRTGQPH